MVIKHPVPGAIICQEFGRETKNDPIFNKFYELFDYKHSGIDFSVPLGTEVFASYDGVVVRNEDHKGMGKVIGIRNGNIVSLYAHLSESFVNSGQKVRSGELIGRSGATGDACTMPHLHFELRDITQPSLKEMVFEPVFEKDVPQYKEIFVYKVNNKNTRKNLKILSRLYYGTVENWQMIKNANNFQFDADTYIDDAVEVLIPNYI